MPGGVVDEQSRFAEYVAARRDVVRRTAYLLCGDWHEADDLAQLTFVRLAAAWRKVLDYEALDAFVRTCLFRVYLSERRRIWRRRERTVAELPETSATEDGAEVVARRLVFAAALRQLPPRQRAVLVCRYYEGLDLAGTAAALNCSVGSVKSQASRGLARLRTLLQQPDGQYDEGHRHAGNQHAGNQHHRRADHPTMTAATGREDRA
jgi:RNA polymerase sigma-70 factor (sigma-E family)